MVMRFLILISDCTLEGHIAVLKKVFRPEDVTNFHQSVGDDTILPIEATADLSFSIDITYIAVDVQYMSVQS